MRRTSLLAPIVAVVLVAAPRLALACAACLARGSDEARAAFLWTAVLLSVLPFCAIGGLAWWLRKRARQLEQESEAGSDAHRDGPLVGRAPSAP